MTPATSRSPHDFEKRVSALDVGLFDPIETQSSEKDRRSWLAVQRAVREAKESLVYLEIGSYLGGSLQQHMQDPRCRRIYSIDNRTRDARHADNSEQSMIDNLRRIAPNGMEKLVCFETDASQVPARDIVEAPDICFIDGLHTKEAVRNDFEFCMRVCAQDAVICFHDAGRTRAGIRQCLRQLRLNRSGFVAHKLPGDTFVVALPGSAVCADPQVRRLAVALNGERWLRTTTLVRRARLWRWIPDCVRPPLKQARDWFWKTT